MHRTIRNTFMVAGMVALFSGTAAWAPSDVAANGQDPHDERGVPRFKGDPSWPETLPNNWVIGQTGGIAAGRIQIEGGRPAAFFLVT